MIMSFVDDPVSKMLAAFFRLSSAIARQIPFELPIDNFHSFI